MLLAATLGSGMVSAYGAEGLARVQSAFNDFRRAAPGARLAILDDAASMSRYGGPASDTSPPSLCAALARVVNIELPAKTPGGNASENDGILILGGNEIFPFFNAPNPVTDPIDTDVFVPTDSPYGARGSMNEDDWLNPAIPVGRICCGAGDSADSLCAIIEAMASYHQRMPARAGYVEFTNRDWQDASFSVITEMPGPGRLLISPDDVVTAANAVELDARFLYCNLHGFSGDPAWKGYDDVGRRFVTALSADSFSSDFIAGSFIYTEACYGLQTAGRTPASSCALAALAAGAAAVVGATGLAFGSLPPGGPANLIDADALARGFFQAALGPNATAGGCLQQARDAFRSSASGLDSFARKTLLQFQLLGDPTLYVSN